MYINRLYTRLNTLIGSVNIGCASCVAILLFHLILLSSRSFSNNWTSRRLFDIYLINFFRGVYDNVLFLLPDSKAIFSSFRIISGLIFRCFYISSCRRISSFLTAKIFFNPITASKCLNTHLYQ